VVTKGISLPKASAGLGATWEERGQNRDDRIAIAIGPVRPTLSAFLWKKIATLE